MTATLISLFSIFIGVISATIFGLLFKKYSFGIIGNSIVGVFGSIFLIKSIGRLGFDPNSIMASGETNWNLLTINLITSALGAVLAVFLIHKLKKRINK